jgi:hypothetical protein
MTTFATVTGDIQEKTATRLEICVIQILVSMGPLVPLFLECRSGVFVQVPTQD